MTFEDPTALFKCTVLECNGDRAGGTPLCARHLREQEISAGATSISEPDVEARATVAGMKAMEAEQAYVGPDPDTVHDVLRLEVPTWDQRVGIDSPSPPDVTTMVPVWNGSQWVLEPKEQGVDLERVRVLVKMLAMELGLDG